MERLIKYPLEAYEQGVFLFAGNILGTWWFYLALAGVAAVLVSVWLGPRMARLSGIRRTTVVALQLAVVALVLALLAEPSLKVTQIARGANTVAVLLDASQSMTLPAQSGAPGTRDAAAKIIAAQVTQTLGEHSDVALFSFADHVARVEDPNTVVPSGDSTKLIESLTDFLGGHSGAALAAVVVLSDGATNGMDGDLGELSGYGVPVHTIGFGAPVIEGDIELAEVLTPHSAAPASDVTARVVLRHAASGEVRLRVRDGESVLASETFQLDGNAPVAMRDVTFSSGLKGLRDLTFELESAGADVLPQNNVQHRLLEVDERSYRVLYLEGEPRWEFKFLRRAVAEDDAIEMVSWLRTTPRKTYRQGVSGDDELASGFPASVEELYGYDLVVLGSLPASVLDDAQHELLDEFVSDRGGAVLALAGRHALADGGWDVKPLARALPVRIERTPTGTYSSIEGSVRPTPQALGVAFTDIGDPGWDTLPPIGDYQSVGMIKPGATTLLEVVHANAASPLLVEQPYGFGRTAILATSTTWRWRMRTEPDDARHSRFWRQLLRHMAGSAQPRERFTIAANEDELLLSLALKDDRFEPVRDTQAKARITAPDGATYEADLIEEVGEGAGAGMFTHRFLPPIPGIYRVDVALTDADGADTAYTSQLARVGGINREFMGAGLNRGLLERIAAASGGAYWASSDLDGLASAISFGGAGIREEHLLPLWDMPLLFIVLLLLKSAEWVLRRVWGSL